MPTVVTFWQTPEDEADFLDFVLATGDVMGMSDRWVGSKEELAPQPLVPYIRERDPDQLLLGLEADARVAVIEPRGQGGEDFLCVSPIISCLIHYRRGRMRTSNRLGQSNLCVYWSYPVEGAKEQRAKDPDFIRWAKKVFGWVRRRTPERVDCHGHPYRATKRIREAVDRGTLEAVLC